MGKGLGLMLCGAIILMALSFVGGVLTADTLSLSCTPFLIHKGE